MKAVNSIMSDALINLLKIAMGNAEIRAEILNDTPDATAEESNDDLISKMPDDILHRILYFAGSRKAVQASILSKRWINVWATSPLVNFDSKEFGYTSLDNFAQKFMLLRDHNKSTVLRLRIETAKVNIKELGLCSAGGSGRFRCLRMLKFWQPLGWSGHNLRFGDETLPCLEDLYFYGTDFSSLDIELDQLKDLHLSSCKALEGVMRVSAPNLEMLYCDNISASRLCVEGGCFSSLSNADLCLTINKKDPDSPGRVMKLIAGIRTATSLVISSSIIQYLMLQLVHGVCSRPPSFHNLIFVEVMLPIDSEPYEDLDQITRDFLFIWPNLKTLEIKYTRKLMTR